MSATICYQKLLPALLIHSVKCSGKLTIYNIASLVEYIIKFCGKNLTQMPMCIDYKFDPPW